MSATSALIAIDPGLKGAIAFYDPLTGQLEVSDMPLQKKARARKEAKNIIDEGELFATIELYAGMGAKHAFIEEVGGMPGQSAPNAFNFGFGAGLLHAFARAVGLSIEPIRPQEWKGALRVPSDTTKAILARASQLIPTHVHLWPQVSHEGRAEAAMLALYGERVLRGSRK